MPEEIGADLTGARWMPSTRRARLVLSFRVTSRYVGLLDHLISAKKEGGRNLDA